MDNNHRINGKCEICKEPIHKGEMTFYEETEQYLCCACQLKKKRELEYKEILLERQSELFEQLGEIDHQLNKLREG